MDFTSVGKNIRRYRLEKSMHQSDLAESVGLSTNYIGMIERGEKIPALDTFINILNVLGVSSDMVLADVLSVGNEIKNSELNERLSGMGDEMQNWVREATEVLLKRPL